MTERERFLARLGEAREVGLVDVKFFFHPDRAFKPEQIFASLNEIDAATKHGRCERHTAWNGDEPAAVSPEA